MDRKNINKENDNICDMFQDEVEKVLVRHRSIIDIMSKLNQYNSRIDRAVSKSVTSCGCISIDASKQDFGNDTFEDTINQVQSHIMGQLCQDCRDIISDEIGSYIFYLASVCNSLDLRLTDIVSKEYDTIKTLGIYSLK